MSDVCSNGEELVKKVSDALVPPPPAPAAAAPPDPGPSPQNNHHVNNISAKMGALREKVSELERAAAQRKAKLDENSAFLQFNWKADVVESWIGTDAGGNAGVAHPSAEGSCGSADPRSAGGLQQSRLAGFSPNLG